MCHCAAYGCTNTTKKEECKSKSFVEIPVKNPGLLKAWLKMIRRENFKPSAHSLICSDHFEETCFEYQPFTNRRQLKRGSIPTIFVTAVHTTYKRITSVTYTLNKHLKLLEKYYDRWKISINVEKSAAVLFTKKRKIPPPPTMYNTTIPWSQSTKYLGITNEKEKSLQGETYRRHSKWNEAGASFNTDPSSVERQNVFEYCEV
ncbi:THAP domain-containing protein 3 [Trichonephila clavipes]|nr:THAP domain-containing protein 3 [Trichonephila clavipes]